MDSPRRTDAHADSEGSVARLGPTQYCLKVEKLNELLESERTLS